MSYSTDCSHTATISFSSIVALSNHKQPYVTEVTSSAWTRRWLDVAVRCRLKSWIFSTLFASLQMLQTRRSRCPSRFIRAVPDTPFALPPPPPELRIIAPFTLIFNVELPLHSRLSRSVWTPLKITLDKSWSHFSSLLLHQTECLPSQHVNNF